MNLEGMDELDHKIIDTIKDNARLTYSEIGEVVGTSRVTVKNRMDILEKKGIIQGYRTIVDETKGSDGLTFFLDIEALPELYENVIETLASNKMIRKLYSTTGDCRMHAIGFSSNTRTLDSYVNYLFRNTKGIRKIGWHTVLSTLKDMDGGVEYERKEYDDRAEHGEVSQ